MVDIRQTREYGNYLSEIGWTVEHLGGVNYFIKKLPLIGAIMKVQRPKQVDTPKVIELTKKYKVKKIINEPKTEAEAKYLISCGYKQTSSYLPSKTLFLDLTKSKERLLKEMRKDARVAVNKNGDLKISDYGEKVEEFRKSWKRAVGLRRYVPFLDKLIALKRSFGKDALFIAQKDSGAIFLKADKVAYYWQAFTGAEGRKNQTQYKIVWGGILWARKRGARVFDFEGIYDERFPNKSWLGFTHFKKSFGGKEVNYPGAFVKKLLPFNI